MLPKGESSSSLHHTLSHVCSVIKHHTCRIFSQWGVWGMVSLVHKLSYAFGDSFMLALANNSVFHASLTGSVHFWSSSLLFMNWLLVLFIYCIPLIWLVLQWISWWWSSLSHDDRVLSAIRSMNSMHQHEYLGVTNLSPACLDTVHESGH